MTTIVEPSPASHPRLSGHLRIVRGAASVSILMGGVLWPPWEWGANPIIPLLIGLMSLPFLAVLWRLRKAPYRENLALAAAVGAISGCCAGLVLFVREAPSWGEVAVGVLFLTVQGVLVAGALVTSWLLRGREQAAPRPVAPPLPDIPLADRAAVAKRLWLVRGAALGSVLLAGVPVSLIAPTLGLVFALLQFLPVCMPYFTILRRLRAGPRPDGLALAMGTGGLYGVGAGMLLLPAAGEGIGWPVAALAVFVAAQGILAGGAVVLRRRLSPTSGAGRGLARGILDPFAWLVVAFFVAAQAPTVVRMRREEDRAALLAWLQQARSCVVDYTARHPAQGYPAQLELLGPQGTRCLASLAPSGVEGGYRITYAPVAAEPGGRVPGYVLTARPSRPDLPGQRHYVLDATGEIRETAKE
jgi:hypothetical protein